MKSSISFQARARAIDHLGREQIADVPTAISELWKNAFDAYARNAELHLFDDGCDVAVITDDGHGMTYDDVVSKWLVIGTESKAVISKKKSENSEQQARELLDRDGLAERPKQGQKGIGRLSSAMLGPLLLLVSKKRNSGFVALLIDWRLFENPFLFLDDIKIPIQEFDSKEELPDILPGMFDEIMGNVWGSGIADNDYKKARNERIVSAWKDFSELEIEQGKSEHDTTLVNITNTIIHSVFEDYHLDVWPVWRGISSSGTSLFISNIHDDLKAQYGDDSESSVERAKKNFFATLNSFTNPLAENYLGEFSYKTQVHKGLSHRDVVSRTTEFSKNDWEKMEHRVNGVIDSNGLFRGNIVAFGQDLGTVDIPFQGKMPTHHKSRVGNVKVLLGSYEADGGEEGLGGKKSSMEPAVWTEIDQKLEKYCGLKVYRDGLRVMPYGRTDNDFFEIEQRRTRNAGLAHYSIRNMVGAISLDGEENKNLRDKAGREGFIENKASKAFRDVIINLLKELAKRYYGRATNSLRHQFLSQLGQAYDERKAKADLDKTREKQKRAFKSNLAKYEPAIRLLLDDTDSLIDELESVGSTADIDTVLSYQRKVEILQEKLSENKIMYPPKTLSTSQERLFRQYKDNFQFILNSLKSATDSLHEHLERLKPKSPGEIAKGRVNRNIKVVVGQLRRWEGQASSILGSEKERLAEMISTKHEGYKVSAQSIVSDIESGAISLSKGLELIDAEMDKHQSDNEQIFIPYINALQSLQENIDLVGLADFTIEQTSALQEEVDRLNSLAQLGITVEIIGHELDHMQSDTDSALSKVLVQLENADDADNLKRAFTALAEKLRFLSPLKLSGEVVREWITGEQIVKYCEDFFGYRLASVDFLATDAFRRIEVYDLKARLFPVFINMINNSLYWVKQKDQSEYKLKLDVVGDKVVVSDNGTGVYADDINSLFTIFFTKKIRGGRGVGLYLCRRNLVSGGHKVYYATDDELKLLSGANFVIEFKGMKNG